MEKETRNLKARRFFSEMEDLLVVIGWEKFGKEFGKIQQNLLPSKSEGEIKERMERGDNTVGVYKEMRETSLFEEELDIISLALESQEKRKSSTPQRKSSVHTFSTNGKNSSLSFSENKFLFNSSSLTDVWGVLSDIILHRTPSSLFTLWTDYHRTHSLNLQQVTNKNKRQENRNRVHFPHNMIASNNFERSERPEEGAKKKHKVHLF